MVTVLLKVGAVLRLGLLRSCCLLSNLIQVGLTPSPLLNAFTFSEGIFLFTRALLSHSACVTVLSCSFCLQYSPPLGWVRENFRVGFGTHQAVPDPAWELQLGYSNLLRTVLPSEEKFKITARA